MRERVRFFDVLRCIAAVAVIAIHVLAPYRAKLGAIPLDEWITAVGLNSVIRWAVPVFILISGALMLADERAFNLQHYIRRRVGKVVVPFIVWSIFYAFFSGLSLSGFDQQKVAAVFAQSLTHATYYHLGFFYYFIPLYFIIPMFNFLVKENKLNILYGFTWVWLITTCLFLAKIDGIWSNDLWLFSGYLPLGYILFKKIKLTENNIRIAVFFGVSALIITATMVITNSLFAGEYKIGRWLSYKTINVVLAASMVFILCRAYGEKISGKSEKIIGFISQHSLGIYLLHPIFLWPMREFALYQGHPALVIPLWIILSGGGALILSYLLSLSAKTRWLLP